MGRKKFTHLPTVKQNGMGKIFDAYYIHTMYMYIAHTLYTYNYTYLPVFAPRGL